MTPSTCRTVYGSGVLGLVGGLGHSSRWLIGVWSRIAIAVFIVGAMLLSMVELFAGDNERILRAIIDRGSDSSLQFRDMQLDFALGQIWGNWFFGVYGGQYSMFGRYGDYIHSYLEIWRQFGLIVFVAFVLLFLGFVALATRVREFPVSDVRNAALLTFIFSSVCILTSRSWGTPYVFLSFGILAGLASGSRDLIRLSRL